jgi:phosphoribosylformylglycinamidine synthase I
MKAAIIIFPGSNCDRDLAVAFEKVTGKKVTLIWHKEAIIPKNIDIIGIPGGFSYGDYLRSGAIAAKSPICNAVVNFANAGGYVLGICNGFQILTETKILPGTLMRNKGLKYICKDTELLIENNNTVFTHGYQKQQKVTLPIAHHDGNYFADNDTLSFLYDNNSVAFTYLNNPNGSIKNIAGILSKNKRVLGMMPHPERLNDTQLGGTDGALIFGALETIFN